MFEEHEGVKNVIIREWAVNGAPVGAKNISTCMILGLLTFPILHPSGDPDVNFTTKNVK